MGYFRLSLVAAALTVLTVCQPHPAAAAGAGGAAVRADASIRDGMQPIATSVLHRHRTQSFYCYPKNLWWFYRPYTTAYDGHPRCMPYFHYLGPDAKSQRYVR